MSTEKSGCPINNLALIYAALLLRLWLAVRAIQTGLEKYSGTTASEDLVNINGKVNDYGLTAGAAVKSYSLDHYHGVPEALFKKFASEPMMKLPGPFEMWAKEFYRWCGGQIDGVKLAGNAEAWDKFSKEPAFLHLYNYLLGPALLILGVTILLGVASRTSLFLLGLLYISLTWGLILINQNDGVAWLGTHMVLITMALMIANHNRLTILKKW